MRHEGLRGVVRGRRTRTTIPGEAAEKPLDRVQRRFTASRPDQLWVADFTFVATWSGFVYVPRIASAKMLPDGIVASGEMLPAIAPATMVPPLLRRGHGHQDDTQGAG
jgi:hypothetical protein